MIVREGKSPNWQEKNSIIKVKEVVKLLMINKRSLIYGVPILGLASYISLLLYDCLWYHIRGVFVYIGEFGGAICLSHQIKN